MLGLLLLSLRILCIGFVYILFSLCSMYFILLCLNCFMCFLNLFVKRNKLIIKWLVTDYYCLIFTGQITY